MRERPILFTAEMVRAIREGRKTQTCRPVTRHTSDVDTWVWERADLDRAWADPGLGGGAYLKAPLRDDPDERVERIRCRYQVDDRLYVRETFHVDTIPEGRLPKTAPPGVAADTYYRADGECCDQIPECQCADVGKLRWRPSILMPKWAARIWLDVLDVHVERVQSIGEDDARAEGVTIKPDAITVSADPDGNRCVELPNLTGTARGAFAVLWDATYGAGAWHANGWVWVVSFREARCAA